MWIVNYQEVADYEGLEKMKREFSEIKIDFAVNKKTFSRKENQLCGVQT